MSTEQPIRIYPFFIFIFFLDTGTPKARQDCAIVYAKWPMKLLVFILMITTNNCWHNQLLHQLLHNTITTIGGQLASNLDYQFTQYNSWSGLLVLIFIHDITLGLTLDFFFSLPSLTIKVKQLQLKKQHQLSEQLSQHYQQSLLEWCVAGQLNAAKLGQAISVRHSQYCLFASSYFFLLLHFQECKQVYCLPRNKTLLTKILLGLRKPKLCFLIC